MAEIQSLAAKYNIQQMLYVSRLRDTALKCSDITKREDFCAFTKYQNKSGFLSLNPKWTILEKNYKYVWNPYEIVHIWSY